jgi:hypothetical protein
MCILRRDPTNSIGRSGRKGGDDPIQRIVQKSSIPRFSTNGGTRPGDATRFFGMCLCPFPLFLQIAHVLLDGYIMVTWFQIHVPPIHRPRIYLKDQTSGTHFPSQSDPGGTGYTSHVQHIFIPYHVLNSQ